MRTIDVDFDVFKALTMRRPSEDVTENDVFADAAWASCKEARLGYAGR